MDNNTQVAEAIEADIESVESVKTEVVADDAAPQEQAEETPADKDGEEFVPFPKKAKNAISRRDKEIAKLRMQLRELQSKPQQVQAAPKVDDAPKPEQFETYGDYIKASALYDLKKELRETQEAGQKKATEGEVSAQKQAYVEQRANLVEEKHNLYSKTIPDYAEVYAEHEELIAYAPEEIKAVFLEADDAALAFYNLAKEGRLGEVISSTPYRAAMLVAQAQLTPAQVQSSAPKPMRGATGRGKPGKSWGDMSEDELVSKFIK